MFKVNDVVVYGLQGVCEIIGIEDQKIGGEIKKYFVLKPKNNKSASTFLSQKGKGSRGKTAAYVRRAFYERCRANLIQRVAVCTECG